MPAREQAWIARRKWSEAEKAAVLADTDVPGTSVAAVARKHGIAKSVLYNWRSVRRPQAVAAVPGAGRWSSSLSA